MAETGKGLEGAIAADSSICKVDGEAATLTYRGYSIEDLAEHCCFEEVAYLLWVGELPNPKQLDETRRTLASHRPLSELMRHIMSELPASAPPMSLLRTCVSVMGLSDPRAESPEPHANLDMVQEMAAQIASVVASIHRIRRGLDPVRPEPGLSHAGNFLYMLNGKMPDELSERVFDVCLTLHADHGFNASTFAGRVIAATLSDVYSAVTGAIGALRGPLHGGANQRVMWMLQEIGDVSNAADYAKRLLAEKKKVMGFGHRVYRSGDPRAAILRQWCRDLGEKLGQPQWAGISEVLEKVMLEEKGLKPNVDFYSASVYHMLDIPTDLFTPIFAMARCIGWTAHVIEQYDNNRLIRPLCNYTGATGRAVAALRTGPHATGRVRST